MPAVTLCSFLTLGTVSMPATSSIEFSWLIVGWTCCSDCFFGGIRKEKKEKKSEFFFERLFRFRREKRTT